MWNEERDGLQETYEREFAAHMNSIFYYFGKMTQSQYNGLTYMEFTILREIYKKSGENTQGEVIVGNLLCELPHNKSAISKMLGGMERKELIARRPSPENRRNVLVRMTDKGRELFLCNEQIERERNRKIIQTVGPERVMQMLQTIEETLRLRAKLREGENEASET